ncbi:hypothetical protein Esti_003036 [Eimeria stiedai]
MSQASSRLLGLSSMEPLTLAADDASASAILAAAAAAEQGGTTGVVLGNSAVDVAAAAATQLSAAAHEECQAAAANKKAVTAILEAAATAATAAGWKVSSPGTARAADASEAGAAVSALAEAAAAGVAGAAAAAAAATDGLLVNERVSHVRRREVARGARGRARVRRGRGRVAASKSEALLQRLCDSSSGEEQQEEAAVYAEAASAGSASQSPRSNPQRLCRRRAAPLATTVEWTRMQVAQCKDLAEKVVWNTSDSPLFRHSLEVRPEPTFGVGLGLYLTRSLSSCCCSQAVSVREAEKRLIPELRQLHQQEKGRTLAAAAAAQQQREEAQWACEGARPASGEHARSKLSRPPEAAASTCTSLQLHDSRSSCAPERTTPLAAEGRQQQQQHGEGGQQQQGTEATPGAAAAGPAGGDTATAVGSRLHVSSAVSPSAGVSFPPEVGLGVTAVGRKRLCSCSSGSCFRVLCFRGDPVLSPFNFMAPAGKGALTAEEKRVLMAPRENAGKGSRFEPYQHLSPAFTLSRLDMPFSLQLQAHPYLSTEMREDVKAIYANHYCALHCKGFFEQSEAEVPCIVVRHFSPLSPVSFLKASAREWCALDALVDILRTVVRQLVGAARLTSLFVWCGHVCSPRCRCYTLERLWRCLWTKHHRRAADIIEPDPS